MDSNEKIKHRFLGFPLNKFALFLEAQGLADGTGAVYATYVRSALRLAEPGKLPTHEQLAQALQEAKPGRRHIFRAAWKQYRAHLKVEGYEAPDLPGAGAKVAEWFEPLRKPLYALLAVMPLTPGELFHMTHGRIDQHRDGLIFYALRNPLLSRHKWPAPKLLPAAHFEAYAEILRLTYGSDEPDDDAPFLPDGANRDVSMPLRQIKLLCKGAPRLQQKLVATSLAELERAAAEKPDAPRVPSQLFDADFKPPS